VIKGLLNNVNEQQDDFGFLHEPVIAKKAFMALRDYRNKKALNKHQIESAIIHFDLRLLKIGMFALRKNLIV